MPEIRRAGDRFRTDGDGVTTWHSFSYGRHYDPDNVGFGPLIAINTERIDAGRGYELHHHVDGQGRFLQVGCVVPAEDYRSGSQGLKFTAMPS